MDQPNDQSALAERKRLAKDILVALSRGQHDKVAILRKVYRELLEVKPEVPSEPRVPASPINRPFSEMWPYVGPQP